MSVLQAAEPTQHGRKDDCRRNNNVASLVERLVLVPNVLNDLAANIVFKWN